jgi:pimeloyl-ACP methyl ester carboxylesterase
MRLFFGLVGFLLGALVVAAGYLAKMMIAPMRQSLWKTPTNVGLTFEDAQFPAQDGVRLSGWFIPAVNGGETVLLVHGWRWNRLGYQAEDMFANVTGSTNVELLSLIKALHRDGFNVLTFDLRNHGLSAAARPVTFGLGEAKDLLGALAYLEGRNDVDLDKIGVIGFSVGANAGLFALPQTNLIHGLIAVQPMTPSLFTDRLAVDFVGFLGSIVRGMAELAYRLFGGPRLDGIKPAFAAAGADNTPVLYLQGSGDSWGSTDDVSLMAEMTPGAQELLFVRSAHRFDGYQYIIDNPKLATEFFRQAFKAR